MQIGGLVIPDEVAKALMGAYLSSDGDAAALQIPNMLEQLGDPYTRWQPPREYETFRVGTDGELQARPQGARLAAATPHRLVTETSRVHA